MSDRSSPFDRGSIGDGEQLADVTSSRPLRVFVASAADLLTDRAQHGEGLIAWQTFSALAERGHKLVVCAREVDLGADPPFDVVETGRRLRWESLEPLAHARYIRRLFDERGGSARFDAVHWLFPQEPLCFVPPRGVNFVLGPRLLDWPTDAALARPRRVGDLVRTLCSPIFATARYRALSHASRILVSTPRAAEDVPSGARQKVTVQAFGVDVSRYSKQPVPEIPTVLFIGRLDPVKRVRALVEAFDSVRARLPGARLVIAGDGPERTAIESLARKLALDGSVDLLGNVPHEDIPTLLTTCTVLCLPSIGEPFGMVVLEAMASGRAVVAVHGGGPDSLVDTGLGGVLAGSGEPWALAEGLLDVLGDPDRPSRMGAYNRRRAQADFAVTTLADSLERCYRGEPLEAQPSLRSVGRPRTAP
jgi:glycosyltransferase involved in cell wall biosynthesis